MDVQVTEADGSAKLITGVTKLEISDLDSSAPLRAELVALQARLAELQAAVGAALLKG
jgi:hypothetical protein